MTLKAVQIIKKAKILTLYPNGGELFGRCWNKKKSDVENIRFSIITLHQIGTIRTPLLRSSGFG